MMMWTQKESALLKDLHAQEQLCVEKYGKYAEAARDPELKQLFGQIQQAEQQHEQLIRQMMGGQLVQPQQSQQQPQAAPPQVNQVPQTGDKEHDAYLCQDALDTEKHVSSTYDVAIFEFRSPQARDALNVVQGQEQQHGERLYAYMAKNGMMNDYSGN